MRNSNKAKKSIEQGIKLCKKDIPHFVHGLISLGKCYEAQADTRQAISIYEKALHITEDLSLEKKREIFLKLTIACEHHNSIKHRKYLDYFYRLSIKIDDSVEMRIRNMQQLNIKQQVADPPHP